MFAVPDDSRVSQCHNSTTQTTNVTHAAYTARSVMAVMSNMLMTLVAGMKLGVLAYEAFEWTDRIGLVW